MASCSLAAARKVSAAASSTLWHAVQWSRPAPLTRREVEDILGVTIEEEAAEGGAVVVEKKARPRLEYEVGEQVRVVGRGPHQPR